MALPCIQKSLLQCLEEFSSREIEFGKYVNIEALAERVKEIGLHQFWMMESKVEEEGRLK